MVLPEKKLREKLRNWPNLSQVKAVAGGSAASDLAEDQEEMVLERDGSPKLPKRNRSSVFNGFPTPVASAKRRLSDQGT